MVTLFRQSPEWGHSPAEVRAFAHESAQGAWAASGRQEPEAVAEDEFLEGRGNLHLLAAS